MNIGSCRKRDPPICSPCCRVYRGRTDPDEDSGRRFVAAMERPAVLDRELLLAAGDISCGSRGPLTEHEGSVCSGSSTPRSVFRSRDSPGRSELVDRFTTG